MTFMTLNDETVRGAAQLRHGERVYVDAFNLRLGSTLPGAARRADLTHTNLQVAGEMPASGFLQRIEVAFLACYAIDETVPFAQPQHAMPLTLRTLFSLSQQLVFRFQLDTRELIRAGCTAFADHYLTTTPTLIYNLNPALPIGPGILRTIDDGAITKGVHTLRREFISATFESPRDLVLQQPHPEIDGVVLDHVLIHVRLRAALEAPVGA